MSRWKDWQKVILRDEADRMGRLKDWHKLTELTGKNIAQCKAMYHHLKREPKVMLKIVVNTPPKKPDYRNFNMAVRD